MGIKNVYSNMGGSKCFSKNEGDVGGWGGSMGVDTFLALSEGFFFYHN